MNRRAFLGAIGLAPVAAVVAVVKPAYASGGYVGPLYDDMTKMHCRSRFPGNGFFRGFPSYDPSSVDSYLRTEEGERLIRNAVRRSR